MRFSFERFLSVLILVLLSAICLEADERFLPGDNGEITACLYAGPFENYIDALEKTENLAPVLENGEHSANSGFWKIYTAEKKVIQLPESRPEKAGVYYLVFGVDVPYAQNGFVLMATNTSGNIFTGGRSYVTKQNEKTKQNVVSTGVQFGKGRSYILVRLDNARGPIFAAIFMGAVKQGRTEYLRGSTIGLPGNFFSEKEHSQLLGKNMVITTDPPFLEGNSLQARVKFLPGAPLPEGDIVLSTTLKTDTSAVLGKPDDPGFTAAKLRNGTTFSFDSKDAAGNGMAELRINVFESGKNFAGIIHHLQSIQGLKAELKQLDSVIEKAEKNTGETFPLCRFGLLQAKELFERSEISSSYSSKRAAAQLPAFISILRKNISERIASPKVHPLYGKLGNLNGAYVSSIDGSVQPYRLLIPRKVMATKEGKMPLCILYHGYVPSYDRTSWMKISRGMEAALEKAGMPMLLTFGRSNTDFLNVGEVDTFDALEDVKKLLPLDPDRIYLLGYSMGGSGVWTTLTHYPGVFAGARVWSGRTDYYYWHNLDRESLPKYIQFGIDMDNPIDLCENLSGMPVSVKHPVNDMLVKTGHSRLMQEKLEKLGLAQKKDFVFTNGGNHWGFSDDLDDSDVYRNMLKNKRELPKKLSVVTFSPKYGKNRWLAVEVIDQWGKRAMLEAELDVVDLVGHVRVLKADNVREFSVNTEEIKESFPQVKSVKVSTDVMPQEYLGIEDNGKLLNGTLRFALSEAKGFGTVGLKDGLPVKHPGLCGPVKEIFCTPFMAVIGTIGSAVENADNKMMAERLAREWHDFAKGEIRVKTDVELSDEDTEKYSLILVGNKNSNAYLKKVSDRLPFTVDSDRYVVGGKIFEKNFNTGFLACYPNPDHLNRLLMVMDGLYWGDHLPINHKWDLVPDYIVYTREKGPRDTNKAQIAGYFDSSWKITPELMYIP